MYLDTALSDGGYRANKLRLLRMRIHTCPHMDSDGGCDPWITIEQGGKKVFSSLEGVVKSEPVDSSPKNKRGSMKRMVSFADAFRSTGHIQFPNMKKDQARPT